MLTYQGYFNIVKRNDLYLASAMFTIALVWFILIRFSSENGEHLVVYKNNNIIDDYSLTNDGEYSIEDGENKLIEFSIKDGVVNVISASCPDKLCVHQKAISRSNEVIVCLPNHIVLMIDGEKSNYDKDMGEQYDAVTK